VAGALDVELEQVSIKGKTDEGMDAIGRGEAIAAHAVALVRRA
jgi:2C-methyl-D-erythritol 2,4-cyclodiphosphate synthase